VHPRHADAAGLAPIIAAVEVRALSWNLFHGRDAPPEPELLTWRSRLLRTTERGTSHAQVNRDLFEAFCELITAAEWDVALLQECPPLWAEPLATAADAEPHLVLTSRNLPRLGALQRRAADLNPDLIGSWEGGSNLTLVRGSLAGLPAIVERERVQISTRPERRAMALTRLAGGLCIANLHANKERPAAEAEVPRCAAAAVRWAAGSPLLFGGDFNLRPTRSGHVFEALERETGLAQATGEKAIDHLLVKGAEIVAPPRQWPAEQREIPDPTATAEPALPVRLSDHSPVEAAFLLPH
jgi:hypothetical protein